MFSNNPAGRAVNGSLWTLPAEIKMYLILGAMWFSTRFVKTDAIRWVSLLCIFFGSLAMLGNVVLFLRQTDQTEGHLIPLMSMFFAGAAAQVLKDRIPTSKSLACLIIVVLLSSAVWNDVVFGLIYRFTIPYLTLYLALVPAGIIRRYNNLGDYSYGIYIYAFPVQQTLAHFWRNIDPYEMMASSLFITLALAVMSWHLIEKRSLDLKAYKYPASRKAVF